MSLKSVVFIVSLFSMVGLLRAQPLGCEISDRVCLENIVASQCMVQDSTRTSCAAMISGLENLLGGDDVAIRNSLGFSYLLQSDKALSDGERLDYIGSADSVLKSVLIDDPVNRDALARLANLEMRRNDTQSAVNYLITAQQAHPDDAAINRLLSRLFAGMGDEGIRQTIPLTRDMYDSSTQAQNVSRWGYARSLYRTYRFLDMVEEASAFQVEIAESIGLDEIAQKMEDPSRLDPLEVETDLIMICFNVVIIIGTEPCSQSIDSIVSSISMISENASKVSMANVAATGIRELGKEAMMNNLDADWRNHFQQWIQSLITESGESARLYELAGTISLSPDEKRNHLESAVRLAPDEWHYLRRLGQFYMDMGQDDFALEQFLVARELESEEEQIRNIESLIDLARSRRQ